MEEKEEEEEEEEEEKKYTQFFCDVRGGVRVSLCVLYLCWFWFAVCECLCRVRLQLLNCLRFCGWLSPVH